MINRSFNRQNSLRVRLISMKAKFNILVLIDLNTACLATKL